MFVLGTLDLTWEEGVRQFHPVYVPILAVLLTQLRGG